MITQRDPVYRFAYPSKAGPRCVARVTLYGRVANEDTGFVLLMLRCVGGAWPDRLDVTEKETKGKPVCKGVLMTIEEEHEWRHANLIPEDACGQS